MHLLKIAAPLLAVGLAVAACSGSAATTVTAPPAAAGPASVAPASVAPASVAPASAAPSTSGSGGYDSGGGYGAGTGGSTGSASVSLAKTSLGTVLVGAGGKTLYVFLADSTGTSACTGSCATNWPPLAGSKPALGAGLTAADFGSITRADGTTQVTFHGRPLYYFAGDQAPGQTNGQGIGSKWYVVGADGAPIK